jgi:hypothetical protein
MRVAQSSTMIRLQLLSEAARSSKASPIIPRLRCPHITGPVPTNYTSARCGSQVPDASRIS